MREINLAGIPDGQRNWTNDRAVYTHGYGVVAAYDNTALSNGQPDFFESDIPSTGALEIDQPRVYFGELSPAYSIVGAPEGTAPVELDFPDDASPTGQKTNTYTGTGGVPMGSLFGKLLFATKFQDTNILLSDLVNPDSRILWDRDPLTRVEKVAPWLTLDQDPYPVVADGGIKWVVDGYTLSNEYPYSSRVSLSDATSDSVSARTLPSTLLPRDQANYVRNSVKAVVDAYDGTVTLYAWDPTDPVLMTWMKAFPGIVEPVVEHVRGGPVARALPAGHVQDPAGGAQPLPRHRRDDVLQRIRRVDRAERPDGQPGAGVPAAVLPDAADARAREAPEFSLTTTFAPQRRQTLAAFMAVSSEPGEDYGKMRVLQLPSNTTIPGPQQVQNNFESDPTVSSQLSLLRRGGSEVEFGNLLSLPFNDGLLYIEPVYIRATTDGYPLLRKVLVGYGQNVALENTLDVALAKVFGTSPDCHRRPEADGRHARRDGRRRPTPTPTPTPTEEPTGDPATDLAIAITQAQRAYEDGQIALAKGDFTAYGEAQDRLKAALDAAAAAEAAAQRRRCCPTSRRRPGPATRRSRRAPRHDRHGSGARSGLRGVLGRSLRDDRRHQRLVVPGHPGDQPRADRPGRRPARQRGRRGRRGESPGRPAARGRASRRDRRRPQPAGAHRRAPAHRRGARARGSSPTSATGSPTAPSTCGTTAPPTTSSPIPTTSSTTGTSCARACRTVATSSSRPSPRTARRCAPGCRSPATDRRSSRRRWVTGSPSSTPAASSTSPPRAGRSPSSGSWPSAPDPPFVPETGTTRRSGPLKPPFFTDLSRSVGTGSRRAIPG